MLTTKQIISMFGNNFTPNERFSLTKKESEIALLILESKKKWITRDIRAECGIKSNGISKTMDDLCKKNVLEKKRITEQEKKEFGRCVFFYQVTDEYLKYMTPHARDL